MTTPHYGPWQRRLMGLHDQKLRRCWWCGEWAYALADCTTCEAPVSHPQTSDDNHDHKDTA